MPGCFHDIFQALPIDNNGSSTSLPSAYLGGADVAGWLGSLPARTAFAGCFLHFIMPHGRSSARSFCTIQPFRPKTFAPYLDSARLLLCWVLVRLVQAFVNLCKEDKCAAVAWLPSHCEVVHSFHSVFGVGAGYGETILGMGPPL